MLLAIDIGNTAISMAVLKGKKVIRVYSVDTRLASARLKAQLQKKCRSLKNKYPRLKGIIICSVVPKAVVLVKTVAKKVFGLSPVLVGTDVTVPLINRYQNPKQVGQDRLVCAYAAMKLCGLPVIVVDFGTAITFDVVSKRKEYLGGIIVPGIQLSADSLFKRAALLPKIKIKAPKNLIGKTTEESILSGLFYGYAALSKGIIAEVTSRIKGRKKVVVTGGYTALMKKFIVKEIDMIDKDLVFKGMRLLFEENFEK